VSYLAEPRTWARPVKDDLSALENLRFALAQPG
jgi:hypothetical protein